MNLFLLQALRLTSVGAGLALLLYLADRLNAGLVHTHAYGILLFLWLLALISSLSVLAVVRKSPSYFNAVFFGMLILRFFASIIFILVFVLLKTPAILVFVANFFVLYLCFQLFEITSLMTNLRPHLEKRHDEGN
jgi:hypothetical protein